MSRLTAAGGLLNEAAEALCDTMSSLHRRGWCDGTGGNFSTVVNQKPLEVLMAPSGVDKGHLLPSDLIVIDGEGKVIRGEGRASAETLLHLTILSSTRAKAVLHTHSQAGTLLSRLRDFECKDQVHLEGEKSESTTPSHLRLSGLEMLKGLEGIHSHTAKIAIPILANSQDMHHLSETARPHLATAPYGILISGHGLYAWGESLPQARRHVEILEFLLEQHWRVLLLGALMAKHDLVL